LTWLEGGFEHGLSGAKSDDEGSWLVSGLVPGAYRVHAARLTGYRIGLAGPAQGEIEVQAPARGVNLLYAYSTVRFESAEELAADGVGRFTIERDGHAESSCDFRGRSGIPSFYTGPGERLAVEIRFEGRETWREELVTPSAGEELVIPIHLQPSGEPASLHLTVEMVESEPVSGLQLVLHSPDESQDTSLSTLDADLVDGVARFEEIPPGRYRGVLRVTGNAFSYYREVEIDLDLSHGERELMSIELELGGRIGILARDARGEALPANIEFRDASGTKLDVTFLARDGPMTYGGSWRLSTVGLNETFPNLAPGDYELHVWYEGFERKVLPATVVAGETTELDVVLKPE